MHVYALINAHSYSQLDQDQQLGTRYDALLQASDMKKAKGSVERELILLKNPGPGSVRVLHSLVCDSLTFLCSRKRPERRKDFSTEGPEVRRKRGLILRRQTWCCILTRVSCRPTYSKEKLTMIRYEIETCYYRINY